MVRLYRFSYLWQAEALSKELSELGIKSRILQKPRDYISHITGQIGDTIELLVPEDDEIRAQAVLEEFLNRDQSVQRDLLQEEYPQTKNHFKRTIVFSFLGTFMLPVIFNLAATWSYFALLKEKKSASRKLIAFFVLLMCWLATATFLMLFIFS